MAAKKKNNSSEENKKAPRSTSPRKTNTPRKKPVAAKKPPAPVSDDNFGLEDVELQPVEESNTPAPSTDEKPKSAFVPASKRPKEDNKKNNAIVIAIVAVLLLVAVYFLILKPTPAEPEPEPVKIVQPKPVEKKQPEPEPVVEPEPEPLAVQTISTRDGRFYVVVGSFYDADLAEDKANDLVTAGIQSFILPPREGKSFYRVGINQANDFETANSNINELKQTFGDEIWVLKH